jgi:hypothetical protein
LMAKPMITADSSTAGTTIEAIKKVDKSPKIQRSF